MSTFRGSGPLLVFVVVSRPDEDGISCVAGKRGAWALLVLRRGLCPSLWCSGVLLSVRNVSLDAFDHSHSWSQLLFQDLLARRLEGGFAVLFAQVGQHVACLEKSAGDGGTITIEDQKKSQPGTKDESTNCSKHHDRQTSMLVLKTSSTHPAATSTKSKSPDLLKCQWCQDSKNVVILGKSSVGKTYLAQALLNAACRKDYSAKFFLTDSLANQLAVLHHSDPERVKFLEAIHNTDVLVLDDFLTTPINEATAHQLLTIIAERENRGATIVTSQFAPHRMVQVHP